jgi:hypothetical protein
LETGRWSTRTSFAFFPQIFTRISPFFALLLTDFRSFFVVHGPIRLETGRWSTPTGSFTFFPSISALFSRIFAPFLTHSCSFLSCSSDWGRGAGACLLGPRGKRQDPTTLL